MCTKTHNTLDATRRYILSHRKSVRLGDTP